MRGKVSRVILVCTLLILLSHAWWPFEKNDEKPKKRGRRGREETVEDTVEEDDRQYRDSDSSNDRRDNRYRDTEKDAREERKRDQIKSPSEKARDRQRQQ